MSDKDTISLSEALKLEREIYEQMKARQQKPPEPDYISELETHLAAVTAERDDLAALMREVTELEPTEHRGGLYICVFCGAETGDTGIEPHTDDCVITRARRALADEKDKKPENDTRNWPWWD